MIKEDEPLPSHTTKDYWECYAKVVLEELYCEEFSDLLLKDKPDIQDISGKFGIEVTLAIDRDQIRAESIYTQISYNNNVHDEKGLLKTIEKCGCKLENGILVGKPGKDSFDLILSAFDGKLNKLNGKEYKYFKKNCLFIFSDILANDRMLMKAIEDMQQKQKNSEKQFYKVFVLVPGYCYCLNLCRSSYGIHQIESRTQCIQAIKARELVEKYEEAK